ncbi:protein-disulfide reductase DsbD domain-containing protein [Sneathiella limimaris]|uniref:protein-disulfide reductase DsbD domain-containing protein n=1 Tax=Sneathiella limimaris TaxID=1964213 RepID=UPI00146BA9A6|nr:protein-disulfide reductase DsbD domain-containing protein [Sneathiella limimaris]
MKIKLGIFVLLLVLVSGLGPTSTVSADTSFTSEWIETDVSKTRLIAGQYADGEKNTLLLGLQIKLAAGWKTYWRSPGDSGIPPRFNWQGSENIERVSVKWPVPSAFDSFGYLTWGYEDEVVLPLIVKLKDSANPVQARLTVDYGVCEKICIPLTQEFALEIPAGASSGLDQSLLATAFLDKAPTSLKTSDLVTRFALSEAKSGQLQLQVTSTVPLKDPVLILEGEDGDFFTIEQTNIASDHKRADFLIKAEVVRKTPSLSGRYLFATFFDHGFAVEGIAKVN